MYANVDHVPVIALIKKKRKKKKEPHWFKTNQLQFSLLPYLENFTILWLSASLIVYLRDE